MASRRMHLANVLGGNVFTLITAIVGLIVTREVTLALGKAAYTNLAAVVHLSGVVTILSNPLSGAVARYVTQGMARGRSDRAAAYTTNTLAIVTVVGLVAILAVGCYGWLSPSFSGLGMVAFMVVMTLSVVVVAVAGVFSTGTFVREVLVVRSIVRIISRSTYCALVVMLVSPERLGMWSLAVAAMASALIQILCFGLSFAKLLPEVRIRPRDIETGCMREVGAYVGWMLLAYVGAYVIRSGTLVLVKEWIADEVAFRFVLAVQVGTMALQGLTTLGVVTSPATYKALAVKDFRLATRQVERFLFMSAALGLTGLAVMVLEGQNLLQLWLGDKTPQNMTPMLIGAAVTALATSSNVPISVFLAGANRVRSYGIACLIEGVVVIGGAWGLLFLGGQRYLVHIVFLPAAVVLAKNALVIPLLYRESFVFSPIGALAGKGAMLILLVALSLAAWNLAHLALDQMSVVHVGLRALATALPLGVGAAVLVLTRK